MWPDTEDVIDALLQDMNQRANSFQRRLKYGYRAHVIVRETEGQAMDAARLLVSKLDDEQGSAIRKKSLDSQSVGVNAQSALRERADADGFAEAHLWTGVGRARSGCGAAIVGDPDQVLAKLLAYQKMGIEAFILSGYPHLEECDLFARYVLPRLDHKKLTLT
jgi:alkanesulfonate monooxygenase